MTPWYAKPCLETFLSSPFQSLEIKCKSQALKHTLQYCLFYESQSDVNIMLQKLRLRKCLLRSQIKRVGKPFS